MASPKDPTSERTSSFRGQSLRFAKGNLSALFEWQTSYMCHSILLLIYVWSFYLKVINYNKVMNKALVTWSLLNCVPYVLTCQRALRAYVSTCFTCLRAHSYSRTKVFVKDSMSKSIKNVVFIYFASSIIKEIIMKYK